MRHTIEIPHTNDYPNEAVLISSDNTTTHVNWNNTKLFALAWDPELDFCIEHHTDNGEIERIFTDDQRVFNVLHELGFTAIIMPYGSEEQLDEYRNSANESKILEWDVLDKHDGESIYLKSLTLSSSIPTDEEYTDIPRKADVYEVEDINENKHRFDQAQTTINRYRDYPEMDHVLVTKTGKNGGSESEITFNEPDLITRLEELDFDTFTRRFPSAEIVAVYEEYQKMIFDSCASAMFDIAPSDEA